MKKKLLSVCAIAVALVAAMTLVGCGGLKVSETFAYEVPASGYTEYTDGTVSFYRPSGWYEATLPKVDAAFADSSQNNINVMGQETTQKLDLLRQKDYEKQFKEAGLTTEFKFFKKVKVGDREILYMRLLTTLGVKMHQFMYVVTNGSKLYTVTLTLQETADVSIADVILKTIAIN